MGVTGWGGLDASVGDFFSAAVVFAPAIAHAEIQISAYILTHQLAVGISLSIGSPPQY